MSCAGICCAVFTIDRSYAEIIRGAGEVRDGGFIADMLVPLTANEAAERWERFGFDGLLIAENGPQTYTCKHWDENSRLCRVYETRPNMCRKFPEDNPCHGCGLMPIASVEREVTYAEASA